MRRFRRCTRDLFVAGRAWRTFLLKIWGHEIKENIAAVPDTYAAISRIPGVHSALFSILAGGAEIVPHRGSAAGVIRFHYPLIVPKEPEKCWIEISGHHFFWKEGEPLVFDDTREHWVKNETEETRVVLIIGIVGAFIGVWLLTRLGFSPFAGFVGSIVNAVIGSVILLLIVGFIRR